MSSQTETAEISPDVRGVEVDDSLSFEFAMSRAGLRYWRKILDGRAMPDRRDVEPPVLGACRPHLSLISIRADAHGEFELIPRLLGSSFSMLFKDIADGPLQTVLEPQVIRRWQAMTDLVLMRKAPVRIAGQVAHLRQHHMNLEMLLAPLTDGADEIGALYMITYFHSSADK